MSDAENGCRMFRRRRWDQSPRLNHKVAPPYVPARVQIPLLRATSAIQQTAATRLGDFKHLTPGHEDRVITDVPSLDRAARISVIAERGVR